jgi:aspartyl-tRNA(Asn)/glutamyl-tRNA(Gln) amidotransferase subunit A
MSDDNPQHELPQHATLIAEGVRVGTVSAAQVLEEHLARIDERESEINAFNLVLADEARVRAAEIDVMAAEGRDPGLLAGVPIALKDNMCTRGIPTTCSSKILGDWKPPYDATVVTRLRDAGAVIVGKTNLDEFAMGSSTENSAFGPTRNPHDTTRVPGGSSGGSAAAVAARFASVSLGSDTGGSIRQPAALCGTVGVKPTYGAVSRLGLIAFGSSLDQIGPFAHTVDDAALTLEAISGHDPADSTSIERPPLDLRSKLQMGAAGLRVGRITDLPSGASPDVAARLDEAFEALAAAGAEIVDVEVPAFGYGLTAYYLIAPAEASSNLARFDGVRFGSRTSAPDTNQMYMATRTDGFGAEVKRRIMLGTYALSAGYQEAYYGRAQKVRRLIANDFAAAYANVDVLLTPASPTVAFEIGDKSSDPLAMYLCDTYTIPSNLSGDPGMSVPFGTGDGGLPVGVQVLAPALQDHTMFRAAAELERYMRSIQQEGSIA